MSIDIISTNDDTLRNSNMTATLCWSSVSCVDSDVGLGTGLVLAQTVVTLVLSMSRPCSARACAAAAYSLELTSTSAAAPCALVRCELLCVYVFSKPNAVTHSRVSNCRRAGQ